MFNQNHWPLSDVQICYKNIFFNYILTVVLIKSYHSKQMRCFVFFKLASKKMRQNIRTSLSVSVSGKVANSVSQ